MDIATLVIAGLALVVSCFAFWASHRSAVAAEKSAADGRRSADIAAEQLALDREASRPRVDLQITKYGNGIYLLKNEGAAPAPGLALAPDDEDGHRHVAWDDRLGAALKGGQAVRFTFSTGNIPTNLSFTWTGLAEPVTVSVPA